MKRNKKRGYHFLWLFILTPLLFIGVSPQSGLGEIWKWQNSLPQRNNVLAADQQNTLQYYKGASWSDMTGVTSNHLQGIWGSSGNDVYAVGNNGTILHYDGSVWSPMASGTSQHLYAVWGSSGNDVFAVGTQGTILHFDGSVWSAMASGTDQGLNGLWGSAWNSVFAVGAQGTILYYGGNAWYPMTSGTTQSLRGIWGSSATNVFVVGDFNIFCFNGVSWSIVDTGPTPWVGGGGIWGSSGNNIFVLVNSGMIMHYDGNAWSIMPTVTVSSLYEIWGDKADDIYAAGYETIVHYDGKSWSYIYPGINLIHRWFGGIWGSSGKDIFLVGSQGTILHYGGSFEIFLPVVSKGVDRVCPGGRGAPSTLNWVNLTPNYVPALSTISAHVQFSFSDPDGDLDNGTVNYVGPSGQTVSLGLPGDLAGKTSGVVSAWVSITTDSQRGSFKIPVWLMDKSGNCSNIVSLDWGQY